MVNMNHLFQFSVYTGQQLLVEALQRWLFVKPGVGEAESSYQRRRSSIKGLLSLLLKTGATAILATVLDAAIEYRRRQLLLGAEEEAEAGDIGTAGTLNVTRAGISSWKARLLLGIDEMERQAGVYGIQARHRFAPGGEKLGGVPQACDDPLDGVRKGRESWSISNTVQQLLDLTKSTTEDDARGRARLDGQIDRLVDHVLSSSYEELSTPFPAMAGDEQVVDMGVAICSICMDKNVGVQVEGCRHELCFDCARRLCGSLDHRVPPCPFCRRRIGGFIPAAL